MAAASFKVKAVYDYASSHEDDLPFNVGQIITVNDDEDPEWYGGAYVDDNGVKHEGIFPRNFVEKYEPTAPPRPTRRKKEVEPVATPPPPPADDTPPETSSANAVEDIPAEQAIEDLSVPEPRGPPPVEEARPIESPSIPVANPPETASVPAPAPIEPQEPDTVSPPPTAAPQPKPALARAGPPPVLQKPSSNAFKDRIAAFNKTAAPPVTPFKPGGLGSSSGSGSGFIRKPFVAPPPSRNAYVPPPRDVPTAKVYRREEDPEIKEAESESQEHAEKAGLIPAVSAEPQGDDQPKPTTLKERIALLQKQQAEAAQRHMDAAAKKEKPKRPPKKRVDSEGVQDSQEMTTTEDAAAEATPPPLQRKTTTETSGRPSVDEPRSSRPSLTIRRKSTGLPENDGNEADMSGAGDTTEGQEDLMERDDTGEKPTPLARLVPDSPIAGQETAGGDGEEEDDDVDPEVRRKEELRARMAKMSGGMGMAGMFGPPGMMPLAGGARKPKPPAPVERRPSELSEGPSSPRMAPPPMMVALPGMRQPKLEEETPDHEVAEDYPGDDITPVPTTSHAPEAPSFTSAPPPPVPGGRPAPPPIPAESRPPPPPPPAAVASPSIGSESDDELSENPLLETSRGESPSRSRAPPPIPVASPPMPTSPRRSTDKRTSTIGDEMSPTSPGLSPQQSKRNSRPPPPIPGVAPPIPGQARPPPPPPPGVGPSRTSTSDERVTPMQPGHLDNGEEGEVTEYEGDYDTDIGSSVHHKDALKAHARDSSIDISIPLQSPSGERRPTMPPPIPSGSIPRAAPPPIPSQPAPSSRVSVDAPRAAPPPPPPQPKQSAYSYDDDDYDPYNYNAMQSHRIHSVPVSRSSTMHEEVNMGTRSEVASYGSPPPPPPPADRSIHPPQQSAPRAPPRKSLDVLRTSTGRRSVDAGRPSMDTSFMANDVDLGIPTQWWLASNGIPPVFQGRRDVYTESTESTAMEDSRSIVTKQLFVLFQDYSQTIITSRFDPRDPSHTEVDQSHEPPPRTLRQDELEDAYESFGRKLASSVASKKDSVVGDGKPQALIHELLRPMKGALLPIGTRAYGALVYSNMANALTQVNDAIRPGDILSIRNAKFQGKHGAMHQKYSMEVGKPDHVAIVAEWDGTKKKVRAWEQGRESKKVKQESFKLDDLRSGEVKIWRVMPRTWVGWRSLD
ncbi:hypothetical protein F5Y18DRAFT_39324 [Xylariaceae sp. FL1019]|nr:hypothetical protein F5Y18DRAFT_39324 [Xylariaceae sp. FL1019]